MRAIFIDRDGVICENRSDHVKSWEEFQFLPGAISTLARLRKTDFAIILITNQAVINRGIVMKDTVNKIHARMLREVRRAGGRIDRIMVCPHRNDEYCGCRKPQPGLVMQAAIRMNIDLSQSYLIGDAVSDIQAGMATGLRNFLVLTGRGMEQSQLALDNPRLDFRFADDLKDAVDMILSSDSAYVQQLTPAQMAFATMARSINTPVVRGHAT